MYQTFEMFEPMPVLGAAFMEATPRAVATPVAGAEPVAIGASALTGLWSLRFGRFGCSDSETRGGVVFLQGDALMGGDNNFAYQGHWTIEGTELTALLDVVRHGHDATPSIFGTVEAAYRLDCVGEAITPDLFEGRLRRPGHPDARLVMRRVRGMNGGSC
jgi:hypothetical protein